MTWIPERSNEVCLCCKRHVPAHFNVEHHHVFPQAWGGQAIDPSKPGYTRLVTLCATTHNNVHLTYNLAVRLNRVPTDKELQAAFPGVGLSYRKFLLVLCREAWVNPARPAKPEYTLAHS